MSDTSDVNKEVFCIKLTVYCGVQSISWLAISSPLYHICYNSNQTEVSLLSLSQKKIPMDSNMINVCRRKGCNGRLGMIMGGLIYFQHVIIFLYIDEANGKSTHDYGCELFIWSSEVL